MTGSGSPCGACKFLRRKCVRGCVFAPYFCHEQGATHFAAIHKVFGASNVSKLLTNLPVSDRCEAAVTISYEAQARLQDPIYGCVSHIFALQQQVFNLQAQLASLKEQAAESLCAPASTRMSLNEKYSGNKVIPNQVLDVQSWLHMANPNNLPHQFSLQNMSNVNTMPYYENGSMDSSSAGNNYENSLALEENISFGSFEEASGGSISSLDMQSSNRQWSFRDADDLHSSAFGYILH
ncbi:LOB domain-containing protein [Psidium guajava]|nr:LOB domain-containing protein [Psidium guajava]